MTRARSRLAWPAPPGKADERLPLPHLLNEERLKQKALVPGLDGFDVRAEQASNGIAFQEQPLALLPLGEEPGQFTKVGAPLMVVNIVRGQFLQLRVMNRRPVGTVHPSTLLSRNSTRGGRREQ